MKIQSPPGMRDFYPDDMRLREWLFGHWRAASEAFGFEPYDGPIFEFLDLYTIKSGDEITKQLFHVRHGMSEQAQFAIRPEMTPTLARMVAARANALPRPIKWYSIPRLCRAERPQRGRLREFFQWNLDILGSDDPLADAEIVAVGAELFRRVGLAPSEVVIRFSSRPLMGALLASFGVPEEQLASAYALIDRFDKLTPEAFAEQWGAALGRHDSAGRVRELLSGGTLEDVLGVLEDTKTQRHKDTKEELSAAEPALPDGRRAEGGEGREADTGLKAISTLRAFQANLQALGVAEYVQFDLRVVRGLAYYTGIVFEGFARQIDLRALLGGGRYDNLTELVGGPRVPGVGLGAGDAPLIELLKELKRMPEFAAAIDAFVIDAEERLFPAALEVVSALRRAGLRTDFSYKRQNMGKQFKQASARRARFAVIVGAEFEQQRELAIKDMATGAQVPVSMDRALEHIRGQADTATEPSRQRAESRNAP